MKLRAALLAATLALAPMVQGAVVDPAEPPKTPAGGAPEGPITIDGVVGGAITLAVILAILSDDDNTTTTTTTTTTTR